MELLDILELTLSHAVLNTTIESNVESQYQALNSDIKLVKDNLLSYMKAEIKEDFVEKCSQLQIFFDKLFDLLPIFAMYKENSLINRYVLDNNYKAKLSNEYISLQRLLQAAKLNTQDLDDSIKTGTGLSLYAKSKIKNNIINNIEIPFNKFYSQEEINIEIDVNSNVLGIVIKSGENGVINVFSERSQVKFFQNRLSLL